MERAHYAVVPTSDGCLREERALEVRVRRLCDKVDSFKRRESKICSRKATICKVADDQCSFTSLVTGLYQSTVSSYESTCFYVDRELIEAVNG